MSNAIVFSEYGAPDVLHQAAVTPAEPGPGQVRIQVKAATVNPLDLKIRAGYMAEVMPVEFPAMLGIDAAGVVDAVGEAVSSRVRPVLMTTFTTVFGLAPLVFIPGAGTELYRGLGVIVLTGLVFSTLVTLTVLPALLVALLGRDRGRQPRPAQVAAQV